jgi:hypothetical protein
MNSFAFLCLGLGIGVFIGAWWMFQVLRQAEAWWNGRLDWWAAKVIELTDQVIKLRESDRDPEDYWKDE